MSEYDELATKLSEISEKLATVADLITTLVNAIKTMGQHLGDKMTQLTEMVKTYGIKATETGSGDFDQIQSAISKIFEKIDTLNTITGQKSLQDSGTALNELLDMLDTVAFDPEEIKIKINEITTFIEEIKKK
ncbi:MAG: hypothetical protein ACTSRW_05110 [Candidatus Helarchaeota archaeon]